MVGQASRLEMRQGQSLVMTPQLQMSLKLLQFSTQDLVGYIERELEQNPMLERDESDSQGEGEKSQELENINIPDFSSVDLVKSTESKDILQDTTLSGIQYENTWGEGRETSDSAAIKASGQSAETLNIQGAGGRQDFSTPDGGFEETLKQELSLKDHILDQVYADIPDTIERNIALHLTDMLDENGYIQSDFSRLAERLSCKEKDIHVVLLKLQQCDPVGVFARSLSECLALQLKDKDRFDPAMEALIKHLDLVAEGNIKKLQKLCRVEEEDIHDMCVELRALDPKPGRQFSSEIVHPVVPDVFMKQAEDGSWKLELNSEVLPRLLVNNYYASEVKRRAKEGAEKAYITEQLNTANWLVRTLNQRAETILRVATELVVQQKEFFEHGIHYLRPLVLKDIAEALEIHESTVARVTANKYIATPRGRFEMRYFFSSGLQNTHGEEGHSSTAVQHMIKELINSETADDVLSDDKIALLLKTRGICVARRTVAKYREGMNIPSSSKRKKQWKAKTI